jgi:hypothetical protein
VCSLRKRSRGIGSEQREGFLGAALHLARLAPDLGPGLVGDHVDESSVFLSVLTRREFLPLLKLRPGIRAALGPVPQPRDVSMFRRLFLHCHTSRWGGSSPCMVVSSSKMGDDSNLPPDEEDVRVERRCRDNAFISVLL